MLAFVGLLLKTVGKLNRAAMLSFHNVCALFSCGFSEVPIVARKLHLVQVP